jgi:hypothetical protein
VEAAILIRWPERRQNQFRKKIEVADVLNRECPRLSRKSLQYPQAITPSP